MPATIADLISSERLPSGFAATVEAHYRPIADAVAARRRQGAGPLLVGICGSQGSGKSTMALFLQALLQAEGQNAARLSLDDLYLTHRERRRLAHEVHPLLATRGVPGTHDVDLGADLISRLMSAGPGDLTPIPFFDKAADTRADPAAWPVFQGRAEVILFEGWCVGALPQPPQQLEAPINALERDEDPDGRWRRHVDAQLAGPYRRLFGPIELMIFVQAPSFDCVLEWRTLQERKLADALAVRPDPARRAMTDAQLRRFIAHYERITRRLLEELPGRADIVVPLGEDHRIRGVVFRR